MRGPAPEEGIAGAPAERLRHQRLRIARGLSIRFLSIFLLYSLSYGEVWARRNVYSASQGYYTCTATHGTPRGTHGGHRGVVQHIPKGRYNIQGGG